MSYRCTNLFSLFIYNNYINIGLKGDTYEFAIKLDQLLSFKSNNLSFRQDKSNDLMW